MKKKSQPGYLSFTRKERTGIIVIIFLILLFTILPFLYSYFRLSKPDSHSAFEKEIASLSVYPADSPARHPERGPGAIPDRHKDPSTARNFRPGQPAGELFRFDPNTLSVAGWKKLGIPDRTIATLQNYLARGGKFRRPEDIGKIWGLHEDEVQRLMPYVSISGNQTVNPPENKPSAYLPYARKDYSPTPVDINLADTMAFIALPGIGSRLANRIIAFREKLGGFYKVEQVAETFALPDSTFRKIQPRLVLTHVPLKRINLNTASPEELKAHPYIRYTLANAIVQFRAAHGKFSAVSDIRKILIVTDEIYNKLEAYLVTE